MAQLTNKTIFCLAFVVLFSSFTLWSLVRHQSEHDSSLMRATTLAEQLSTSLAIIAADRTRALDTLAGNWPLTNANLVDWFNVQGVNLMRTLPGIHDLLLYEQGVFSWAILSDNRTAIASGGLGVPVEALNGRLITNGQRAFVLYKQEIASGSRPYWQISMLMDPRSIIAALTADWHDKSVAFSVEAEDLVLFTSAEFQAEYPSVRMKLEFAGGDWTLIVQSQEQAISSVPLLLFYSFMISLLISALLTRWLQQRNEIAALSLVYRSAADVSPDAMFIFKFAEHKHSDDFYLFSCNSAATTLVGDLNRTTLPAEKIGRLLGIESFDVLMRDVIQQATPYFQLLKIKRAEHGIWLKLQIVPMPEGVAVTLQDVTKEQLMQQKITYQANHDQLTGLLNRYSFSQQLESVLKQNDPYHLCYIDMDHFKQINDTCGHIAGDELLKRTAGILASVQLEADTLARVGGDEFCLLLKSADAEVVKNRLKGLLDRISQFRFVWNEQTFSIGASIGVVLLDGALQDVQSALKAADSGCYLAKASGRNRYFLSANKSLQLIIWKRSGIACS